MAESAPASIALFFVLYKDEHTVRLVATKALALLQSLTTDYEVIIVDDGSPDRAGEIADEVARENASVRVIHHPKNLGYGAAVRSGLGAATKEFICFVDGDDEYEIEDFRRILKLRNYYDLIITFRYKKIYAGKRIFISWVYNKLLRFMFRIPFRDVSTGMRMVRKTVLDDITLETVSPFIGAEIAIKTMLKGYRVGEVGIQTFPRTFGASSSTSVKNIVATMRDALAVYRRVFSDDYDLPSNRTRMPVRRAEDRKR
jgi:glycosyltransferase involved in cell wall biosynthesis